MVEWLWWSGNGEVGRSGSDCGGVEMVKWGGVEVLWWSRNGEWGGVVWWSREE